jgi:hypothetical protein
MFRIYSQIMSAIAAGDPALAERRMRQHIGATQARAAVRETTEVPLRSPTTSTPVPTPIRTWSGILIRQMTQDSDALQEGRTSRRPRRGWSARRVGTDGL